MVVNDEVSAPAMRVDGSIQTRSRYDAPVEFGLRTGETIIIRREAGRGPAKLLALVESVTSGGGRSDHRRVTGTIQILAIIQPDNTLLPVTSVPPFAGDVEPIAIDIGTNYYGTVEPTVDPATKSSVQPVALNVGQLLTDARVPVVLNACGFNRHSVLLAQSGAGKSYALGVMMEELISRTTVRLLVVDPNGDFGRVAELPEARNVTVAESRDPSAYRSATKKLARRASRGVVLNLNRLENVLWESVLVDVLGQLWERRDDRRPTLIIVDEAHNFVPSDAIDNVLARLFMRIAAEGRKYGLWLVMASQRPQKLHANIISQCDNLIVMKLSSQFDLDHVAGSYGAITHEMLNLVTGFRSGSALAVGRFVKSPTLLRFRDRRLPEAGGDIALTWACVNDTSVAG